MEDNWSRRAPLPSMKTWHFEKVIICKTNNIFLGEQCQLKEVTGEKLTRSSRSPERYKRGACSVKVAHSVFLSKLEIVRLH